MTIRNLISSSSGDSSWFQQSKFQGTDTISADSFARLAIDISDDGMTCIIGAHLDDKSSGTNAGAAYIFIRSGSTWTQQAKLQASDAAADDYFGGSVAMSSDGNTVAIGAYSDDNSGGSDAGSAYIFIRSGSTWTQQAKLQASDAAANDVFGESISLSSDGNTVAIGARWDDNAKGSAYIFIRSGSTWTQQAKLQASDAAVNTRVHYARLSADGNTCGFISPVASHSGKTNAGAAYIFTRSGSTWTQQAKLIASDPTTSHGFQTFNISNDGNTVAIGATRDSTAAYLSGAVYVFTRSGSTWTQQAKLFMIDALQDDYAGQQPNLSTDGSIIAVSSPSKSSQIGQFTGAVYVFAKSGNTWIHQAKLVAGDQSVNGFFGEALTMTPDGKNCIIGSATTFAYHFAR